MRVRFGGVAILVASLAAPSSALAVHPVLAFASEYLLSKVVDEGFDALSGKPNLKVLDRRLRELEADAAIRGEMRDEIRRLREGLSERVTVAEFRKLATSTTEQLDTIQKRLDDLEMRVERQEVELADVKHKTTHGTDPKHFLALAAGYDASGQHYKAVACYNLAAGLGKPDADLHVRRGRTYLRMKAAGVAAVEAADALRLDAKCVPAYLLIGQARVATGADKPAVASFTECLRLDPTVVAAHYGRAAAYSRLGQRKEAEADMTDGARLDPFGLWFATGDKPLTRVSWTQVGELAANKTLKAIMPNESFTKEMTCGVPVAEIERGIEHDNGVTVILLARPQGAAAIALANQGKDELGKEIRYEATAVGPFTVHRPYDAYWRRKKAELDQIKNPTPNDVLNRGLLGDKEPPVFESAFCLVGSKVMVCGSIRNLDSALNKTAPFEPPPGLLAALRLADPKAHIGMAWDLTDFRASPDEKPIPGVDLDLGREVTRGAGAVATLRFDDGVQLRVTVVCRDAATATKFKTFAESLLKAVPAEYKKEGNPNKFFDAFLPMLDRVKVVAKESVVEMTLSATVDEAKAVLAK